MKGGWGAGAARESAVQGAQRGMRKGSHAERDLKREGRGRASKDLVEEAKDPEGPPGNRAGIIPPHTRKVV